MYPIFCKHRAILHSFRPFSSRLTQIYRHASSKRVPPPSSGPNPTARVKSPTLRPTNTTLASDATGARLSPRQNQKVYAAKQLYDLGVRNVYTAPSHFGKLASSWLIGTFCIGYALRMGTEGYHKLREGHGYGTIIKHAVEGGNKLVMIFFTLVGGYAVLRFNGLIKSLDLIRKSGLVQLRISVRRVVPFLKPKEFIVPSYNLRLPHQWRPQSERLPDRQPASTSRTLRRAMTLPFRKFKDFVIMDGILAARFESTEGMRNALLDANGTFTRSMSDLETITHEVVPWES